MDFNKITDFLDSLIPRGIPSVDCIIYKDHKPLYRYMTGTTDAEKTQEIKGNELYLMFSMTKVQTMTAVMQLVERGMLSLEDEVSKYLPTYKNITVKKDGEIVPSETPMQIKHLVSMQSGLDYDLERAGIKRVLEEKGQVATTRELVDAFVETPLDFEPGEHFQYSLSHDVAAAVVEVVSGMTFGEYLKKNIWEPLHMDNTFFAKPMNYQERLAAQFLCDEKGEIAPMEPSCVYQLSENYESGGAGLVSCTEDYSKFGDAIACGGVSREGVRILEAATIEKMKENLLHEISMQDITQTMGRLGYGYGCGVQILLKPELLGSPAPVGIFGWDGAAGSVLMMDTKSKISVVYTQHVRNCGWVYGEVHPKLRDLVFG